MKKNVVRNLLTVLIGLLLLTFLTNSCNNWMDDDGFMSDIEDQVRVANAVKVNPFIRCANSKQGDTAFSNNGGKEYIAANGTVTMKVEVFKEYFVSCTIADSYGFYKWAAFSTNDFPITKNYDITYSSPEEYAEKYGVKELGSDVIEFMTPNSPITEVRIHKDRKDIFIMPIVADRPRVSASLPAAGTTNVVRNMALRIVFSKPMDEATLYTKDAEGNTVISDSIDILMMTGDFENMQPESVKYMFDQASLGSTKKTLTLRLAKDQALPPNNAIRLTIAKDVTDIYGYSMESNETIAFTTGIGYDSLAPRIDSVRAGVNDVDSWGFSKVQTFMQQGGTTVLGIPTVPLNNLKLKALGDETTTFGIKQSSRLENLTDEGVLTHRTKGPVNIWIFAKDITENSSGTEESESDVYMVTLQATHLYNADGTPSEKDANGEYVNVIPRKSYNYISGEYDKSVTDKKFPRPHILGEAESVDPFGYLISYDLSDMPDGLIRIDVGAIDVVGNDSYSFDSVTTAPGKENGARSIYVIKDTVEPKIDDFKSKIVVSKDATLYGWLNKTTFNNFSVTEAQKGDVTDAGNIRLRSVRSNMDWAISLSEYGTPVWKKIDENDPPKYTLTGSNGSDGQIDLFMKLRDDLQNTSEQVYIGSVNYDETKPVVGQLKWVDTSFNDRLNSIKSSKLADNNILLEVPFKEQLSGAKVIRVKVYKEDDEFKTPIRQTGTRKYYYNKQLISAINVEDENGNSADVLKTLKSEGLADTITYTDGTLYIDGLVVGEEEASYMIEVEILDSAVNASEKKVIKLLNDKTKPVVNSVSIENLVERIPYGALNAKTYWLPKTAFISSGVRATRANIIINATEDNSGVNLITIGDNISLTSTSKVYKSVANTYVEISSDKYEISGNTIKFSDYNTPELKGNNFNFKITDIMFANTGSTPNKAEVSLVDFVGNLGESKKTIKTASGEVEEIFADNAVSSINKMTISDVEDKENSPYSAKDYTNSDTVNIAVPLTKVAAAGTGVKTITLNKVAYDRNTTVKVENSDITQDVEFTSGDGSISATFKNYTFINGETITFNNLKLTDTVNEGKKSITAYITDQMGWNSSSNPADSNTIILDKTAPVASTPVWVLDSTLKGKEGVAAGNVISNQKLKVPFVEENNITVANGIEQQASGVMQIKVTSVKEGSLTEYTNVLKDSGFKLYYNQSLLEKDTDYTITDNIIKFTAPKYTGLFSFEHLKISDTPASAEHPLDGTYEIKVTYYDGAQNSTADSIQKITIVNDSINPVINKVEIPGLSRAVNISDATDVKYWINPEYIGGDGTTNHAATMLPVYITMTETGSGVQVITFGGSVKVQLETALYTINPVTNEETKVVDLQISEAENAIIIKADKALKGSDLKVVVKNLKAENFTKDTASLANTVKVTLSDVALNKSAENNGFKLKDTETALTEFYVDSKNGALNSVVLTDNDSEGGKLTATEGYTNSNRVTLKINMDKDGVNASGFAKFVITGAKFTEETVVSYSESDTDIPTVAETVIPSSKYEKEDSSITFKDAANNYVFRGKTCIQFTNVELPGTDGSKTVSVQPYDFTGWHNSIGEKSTTIILDRTVPVFENATGADGKNASGLYVADSRLHKGEFVYPHPKAGGKAYGLIVDETEKNSEGIPVRYFYTNNKQKINGSEAYGIILSFGAKDNISLYKAGINTSYYYYKHTDSELSSITSDYVLKYGTNPASDVNSNKTSIANKTDYTWCHWFTEGTYSIVVRDEAGNHTPVYSFKVVRDSVQPEANFSKLLTLQTKTNAFVFRNSNPNKVEVNSINYPNAYYEMAPDNFNWSEACLYEYVIKDDEYKIVIKLGSGLTAGDILLGGEITDSSSDAWSEVKTQKNATPLEMYAISHRYRQWPSNSDSITRNDSGWIPAFPSGTVTPDGRDLYDLFGYSGSKPTNNTAFSHDLSWRNYKIGEKYTDDGVSHEVDEKGNIVITIPTANVCAPLSILLKDGCGNLNYMLIKPVAMQGSENTAKTIAWTVDRTLTSEASPVDGRHIGMVPYISFNLNENIWYKENFISESFDVNGNKITGQKYYGSQTSSYHPSVDGSTSIASFEGQTVIGVQARDLKSKVTYYNEKAYIALFNKPESCTFKNVDNSAVRQSQPFEDNLGYTLRARIRAWNNDNTVPGPEDFEGMGSDFSSWIYLRDTGSSKTNEYVFQYPHPERNEPYKIYYFVQDAVGNYEINTVVNSSDNTMNLWMYDNAGPSIKTRIDNMDPSSVTGRDIDKLVAVNNGFRPFYSDGIGYGIGYIVKTENKRDGTSLPTKSLIGDGIVLGCVNGGEKRKYSNYFDLNIAETSGIRAFCYTTKDKVPEYETGISTMGDGSAWYAGLTTNEEAVEKNLEIGSYMGSGYKTATSGYGYLYSNVGDVNYDYYESSYGRSYYSGVKVVATIPHDLVDNDETDLYLHVMDWVGNITTVKLGDNIKWVNENSTTDYQPIDSLYFDDYYIKAFPSIYDTKFIFAATKETVKDSAVLKAYMPEVHYQDNSIIGDDNLPLKSSGLYGWSRKANDVTSVLTDENGSYIELTAEELNKVKAGKENSAFTAYVYDNVGHCNPVEVTFEGDNVPRAFTVYVRPTENEDSETYIPGTPSKKEPNNYPTKATGSLSALTPEEIKDAVYTCDGKLLLLLNFGAANTNDINYPSDFYKGYVSKWKGSEWVKDAATEFKIDEPGNWKYYQKHTDNNTYYTLDLSSTEKYTLELNEGEANPYYQITVVDKAGNENYAYIKLAKDTTAPTIEAIKEADISKVNNVNGINYYNINSTAKIVVKDDGSGIKKIASMSFEDFETIKVLDNYSLKSISNFVNEHEMTLSVEDNLGNAGDVKVRYNNSEKWIYDDAPPVAKTIDANQQASYYCGDIGADGNKSWISSHDAKKANIEIIDIDTSDNTSSNYYAGTLTLSRSGTSYVISSSKVTKFKFKPESNATDLLGWVVKNENDKPEFTAVADITLKKDEWYLFEQLPGPTDIYYFYPVDMAGNAGDPMILAFEKPVEPMLTGINAKNEFEGVDNKIVNKDSLYYFNKYSSIAVKVKNPSTDKDIIITSFTIIISDSNGQITKKLVTPVVIPADEERIFALPLKEFAGNLSANKDQPIKNQKLTVIVNTDLAKSGSRQFKTTPFYYEGDGPAGIKVVSVADQENSTNYVLRKSDSEVVFGSNAEKIKLTLTSEDTVGVAGYALTEDSVAWNSDYVEISTPIEGTQTIYAKDMLGNVSSFQVTLVKDETPPVITVSDNTEANEKAVKENGNIHFAEGCTEISFTINSSDQDIRGYKLDDGVVQNSPIFAITPVEDGETHTFYAIDNVGNINAGIVFTFKKDTEVALPAITIGQFTDASNENADGATVNISATEYVYNGNVAKKLTLSSIIQAEITGEVVTGYSETENTQPGNWVSCGDNNITIILKPDVTNYYIWSKDKVGNVNKTAITLTSDSTGPVSTGDISVNLMNGEAEAGENMDWVKTENVYYINNNVTSISVTAAVEDAVAGLAEQYLCYSIGDGNKTAVTTSPLTIDVSTISDLTEYKIFAVDKVGNYSENLGSIKIKKHITAPVVSQTSAPPYSGIDFIPQYKGENILAIAGGHGILKGDPKTSYEPTKEEDSRTIIYGWEGGRPSGTVETNKYVIRKVEANSTLSLPVKGLPSNQVYCALTYNSIIEPTTWGDLYTVNNEKISGVPVDISKLDKRFMFIFVWYKDQLGNVSVYNLTCPQETGQNWWTSESGKDNKNVGDNGIFDIEVPGTPNVNASIARIGKAGAALVQTAKAFFGGKAQDYVDFPASSVTNQLMTKEISEAVVAEKPVKRAKSAGKAKSSKSQTKAEKFVPEIVKENASTVVEQAPSVVEEKRLEEVVTKVEAEIKKVELPAVDSIIEAPKVIAPVQVVEEAAAVDLGVKPAVVYEEPVEDGNLIHWIIIALVLCCGLAGLIYLLVSKNAKKNK